MTTRNFDEERAARLASLSLSTFVMRGRTFTIRDDVNPNVIILFEAIGGGRAEERSQADQIRIIDEVIESLVMPDCVAAYRDMRASDSPGLMELLDAAMWMIDQITARPFGQASGSGTSPSAATSPAASTGPVLRVAVGDSGITTSETPST